MSNTQQALSGQMQEGQLAHRKECHDHTKSSSNLLCGMGQTMQEAAKDIGVHTVIRNRVAQIVGREDAQCHHSKNRAD